MKDLIVVGGGIAGLSAAYYALKKTPSFQVTLLEAGDRWGGKITTDRVPYQDGDFIIEGGPDTFLATKPWGVTLCKELGLAERLHGTNPHQKNTYVLHKSKLQPLPDGLAMMIPTNIPSILKSQLVSWPGKIRMGFDFLLPSHNGQHDESLGQFVSRRLGREAYENLIEPLMSGIYAGDGDQLSLRSTFPYLHDLEHKYGSLARGVLRMRQQVAARGGATQGSRSAFLTPTTGLAEIVEALVDHLQGVDLRLNSPVRTVQRENGKTWIVELESGEALEADSIILATPAPVTGSLLASFDPELTSVLESIHYASTATVTLAYRQSDLSRPLDGYGYVIPRREGRRALACTWTSTKFPHRAPTGYALIRVFIGRAGQESDIPWNEAGLLTLAREELELTLGITAEPLVSRVFIWENAMPQYNLGHPEELARIDIALEKYPGLALAGNGYRGIGIPDCIHSGDLAVQKILESRGLENSPSPLATL
ncbi:MAG: protoporphyrinogen oxidase [Anaerolineales bacterium]|nr:protoporphyrinogen oxidase [Anaerolineales bacterium]